MTLPSHDRGPAAIWAGPLFYPPVGQIAVMASGCRIEVWPDESPEGCFTGLMLAEGRSYAQTVVLDLSCLWDRSRILSIESPNDDDQRIRRGAL